MRSSSSAFGPCVVPGELSARPRWFSKRAALINITIINKLIIVIVIVITINNNNNNKDNNNNDNNDNDNNDDDNDDTNI